MNISNKLNLLLLETLNTRDDEVVSMREYRDLLELLMEVFENVEN